jgi:cysteine desulfurase
MEPPRFYLDGGRNDEDYTIYLDNNATSKIHPEVVKTIATTLSDVYGNPSSSYRLGRIAKKTIEKARTSIKYNLGIRSGELIFTASATESNNMVIRGRIDQYVGKHIVPHIVLTSVEHSSVYETVTCMAKKGECDYSLIPVDANGVIDNTSLYAALGRPHTVLCLIVMANNEIGTIQDMKSIVKTVNNFPDVHLHVDITQVVGKYNINLDKLGFNSASFSAHKFQGPKGVGGLYLHDPPSIGCVVTGGSQENNLRAGTENTAYISGMAKALNVSLKSLSKKQKRVLSNRNWLQHKFLDEIPHLRVNAPLSDPKQRLYNTLSISVPFCNSRDIVKHLDKRGIFVNVGSACSKGKRSRILEAIGLPVEYEAGTLRLSLSYNTTMKQCQRAFTEIKHALLRNLH